MRLLSLVPLLLIERCLNDLLALDDASEERLQSLQGKRLRVELEELGQPLTAAVHGRQVVLSSADTDSVDCTIRTRLAVLPELQDTANITRLIKADALDIDGDIMLAQQFSQLFLKLDIDWETQLAQRIGDVPAHWLGSVFKRSQSWLKQQTKDQQQWLQEVLVEEKRVLVGKTEFDIFKTQLQELRARIDRLERRWCEQESS